MVHSITGAMDDLYDEYVTINLITETRTDLYKGLVISLARPRNQRKNRNMGRTVMLTSTGKKRTKMRYPMIRH